MVSEQDKKKAEDIASVTIGKLRTVVYHGLVKDIMTALATVRADERKAAVAETWKRAIGVVTHSDQEAIFADDECLRVALIAALEAAKDRGKQDG